MTDKERKRLMLWQLIVAGLLTSSAAFAHSFYDVFCCADKHCHPVPCEEMTINPDKTVVWHGLHFDSVLAAPDGGCHVCVTPDTVPLCAYRPVPLS